MGYAISKKDLEGLSEDQQLAIVESLVLAVAADRKTSPVETGKFEAEVNAIPWSMAPEKVMALVVGARDRILAQKSEAEATSLIQQIGERLPERSLREKVYHAVGAIMLSDRVMTAEEKSLMRAYAAAFGLSRDEIEVIKADLAAGLPPADPPPANPPQ